MKEVFIKPNRPLHMLKFRRAMEGVAKLNDIPVTFVSAIGGMVVRGEEGHIDRFFACFDAALQGEA